MHEDSEKGKHTLCKKNNFKKTQFSQKSRNVIIYIEIINYHLKLRSQDSPPISKIFLADSSIYFALSKEFI